MKALLLVAHGSRRKQSNDEVIHLAEELKNSCNGQYLIVRPTFLELADTMIPDGIAACVSDGATSITVLPYFLNSGRHVVEDIPQIISACKTQHPSTTINLASHLGAADLMLDLIIAHATSAKSI